MRSSLPILIALTGFLIIGCDSDDVDVVLSNQPPETRMTATPPNLLEASFLVTFEWIGTDVDGAIAGYEWRISNNGTDGLSEADTLTTDPVTGEVINPWHFTTSADSTFLVTADMDSFESDVGVVTDPEDPTDWPDYRHFQSHTIFVRAVDDDGAVDQTPAMVSFTATTLAPTIIVDRPHMPADHGYHTVPPTVRLGYTGDDRDYDEGENRPAKVRCLLKRSLDGEGDDIDTIYRYNQVYEELVPWDDPAWSDWEDYDPDPDLRVVQYEDVSAGEMVEGSWRAHYWIFAIQTMDVAGAVSVDRRLGHNVFILRVSDSQRPFLTFGNALLGYGGVSGENVQRRFEILASQSIEFRWSATAAHYFGIIAGYRYGFDVVDPEDDLDPGWQVGVGLEEINLGMPPHYFTPGEHTLVIEAHDTFGQITRVQLLFDVIGVENPPPQSVLLIDDCPDRDSLAWPDVTGSIAYDEDERRDQFWLAALSPQGGGVAGFSWESDSMDLEEQTIRVSDIADYKTLVWVTNNSPAATLFGTFCPGVNGEAPFNWLVPYMETVGDVLMVGESVIHQTIEPVDWLEPIVFNTPEYSDPATGHRIGFGTATLPDGDTVYRVGPTRFGARAWGLNLVDMLSPKYRVYGAEGIFGDAARRTACVGLKTLEWDEDFRESHLFSVPPDFPLDGIETNSMIDWQDRDPEEVLDLEGSYIWGRDEFYEQNVTTRTVDDTPVMVDIPGTSVQIQAVEPMFTAVSRFEYANRLAESLGEAGWPDTRFDAAQLETACGQEALAPDGTMRTEGATVGIMSHMANPGGCGSVLWGFDPYRFDNEDMTKVVRWVLKEHFQLP